MKRTPLIRKTPLPAKRQLARSGDGARRGTLKQTRSTGTPTKAQKARWEDCRKRGCVACHLNTVDHGLARASYGNDLEMHHLLSGGRRIGHDATVCLCHFHHQAKRLPYPDHGYEEQAKAFGPSLERESRRFREFYGADEQLLAYQETMLVQLPPQFGPEASW